MIDIHCHILPGIDDGAQDIAQSLALLEQMRDQGVQAAICTPHINPPAFNNELSNIQACFAQNRKQLETSGVKLAFAAEVRVHADLPFQMNRIPLLKGHKPQGGSQDYLLLELPTREYPVVTDMICEWLMDEGIQPIIAHPERNHILQSSTKFKQLKRKGLWFQLTAGSLLGDFGPSSQQAAHEMLELDAVELVASDSHNLAYRPPKMQQAWQWLCEHYDSSLAHKLMCGNPEQISSRMFND